jgi:hypothetical protein
MRSATSPDVSSLAACSATTIPVIARFTTFAIHGRSAQSPPIAAALVPARISR